MKWVRRVFCSFLLAILAALLATQAGASPSEPSKVGFGLVEGYGQAVEYREAAIVLSSTGTSYPDLVIEAGAAATLGGTYIYRRVEVHGTIKVDPSIGYLDITATELFYVAPEGSIIADAISSETLGKGGDGATSTTDVGGGGGGGAYGGTGVYRIYAIAPNIITRLAIGLDGESATVLEPSSTCYISLQAVNASPLGNGQPIPACWNRLWRS